MLCIFLRHFIKPVQHVPCLQIEQVAENCPNVDGLLCLPLVLGGLFFPPLEKFS